MALNMRRKSASLVGIEGIDGGPGGTSDGFDLGESICGFTDEPVDEIEEVDGGLGSECICGCC